MCQSTLKDRNSFRLTAGARGSHLGANLINSLTLSFPIYMHNSGPLQSVGAKRHVDDGSLDHNDHSYQTAVHDVQNRTKLSALRH
jgi:hypothetical protein